MVLHDINFASAHSDRFIAMKAGRVIREGSAAEIVPPLSPLSWPQSRTWAAS
ncbi:hypothetical protein [Rhodobacter sp. 24-YEA-8]|uniref:hypothetical protein n=1 Tax=Rhodobacter sp. 24-YEA-8 TaxID=1884310 RepID=UPI0014955D51|nr:hypothetical protein [Rhodobacter sp. 24-YEA-8]